MRVSMNDLITATIVVVLGVTLFGSVQSVITETSTFEFSESTATDFSDGTFVNTTTSGDTVVLQDSYLAGTYSVQEQSSSVAFDELNVSSTIPAGASLSVTVDAESGSETFSLSGGDESFDISSLSGDPFTFEATFGATQEEWAGNGSVVGTDEVAYSEGGQYLATIETGTTNLLVYDAETNALLYNYTDGFDSSSTEQVMTWIGDDYILADNNTGRDTELVAVDVDDGSIDAHEVVSSSETLGIDYSNGTAHVVLANFDVYSVDVTFSGSNVTAMSSQLEMSLAVDNIYGGQTLQQTSDGRFLAIAQVDGVGQSYAHIYDTQNSYNEVDFEATGGVVTSVDFSDDDQKLVATEEFGGDIVIFDINATGHLTEDARFNTGASGDGLWQATIAPAYDKISASFDAGKFQIWGLNGTGDYELEQEYVVDDRRPNNHDMEVVNGDTLKVAYDEDPGVVINSIGYDTESTSDPVYAPTLASYSASGERTGSSYTLLGALSILFVVGVVVAVVRFFRLM